MLQFFFCFCCLTSVSFATIVYQDLGGTNWSASGSKSSSHISIELLQANVPGCVHLDWMNGKNISQDLYYRFNDDMLKWIAELNWKYSLQFKPDEKIMLSNEQWLIFEGVDTIATVTLNGVKLGKTSDMFRVYRFNVSSLLQANFNFLEVAFLSAVFYTNHLSINESYRIPPQCPPEVQHGFCHMNLIRKEQCSFSWDWGPAFATQGIWKPVYLMSLNYAVMTEVTATFNWSEMSLEVDLQFLTVMVSKSLPFHGNVSISIKELNVVKDFCNIHLNSKNELTNIKLFVNLTDVKFEKWWPNGYGSQKLYNISVTFSSSQGLDKSEKYFLFGFRKVELIERPINGSDGLSFYFQINDQAIFAKGANWIPPDAFKARITPKMYRRLLQSAADANMNMLRVWGGGIYEDPLFYETADQLGILLWQDFMFACALYPSDSEFLANVTLEVSHVMWKLKHHPSIVVWAGNNENEAALATDWYNTTDHFDRYKQDYINLYIHTIGNEAKKLDSSRPFVSSSPSNGKETIAEGGLAKNPYDTHFGDVHYYNYKDDCLDWTKYPATRFASEFGFQSWPSLQTIKAVTIKEDQFINSKWAQHRQHHPNGNQQILDQISLHFNLPFDTNSSHNFSNLIFLSQIMQGLCYKSQTEFYRRARNETVNGAGHTMGALYWQLNDIWQAPTWSSLEYGGKWKALHYFAAKFYSSIALISFLDNSTIKIYSVSDVSNTIIGTLVITIHSWDTFIPTGSFNYSVTILPHSSVLIFHHDLNNLFYNGGCPGKELCYMSMYISEDASIPTNYFFPVRFKNIQHLHQPIFKIKNMTKLSENEFEFILTSSTPALFVWLETEEIQGRFSDNAFIISKVSKCLKFYSWTPNIESAFLAKKINIKSVNNIHLIPEDVTESPESDATSAMTWLENDGIKLVFALVGSFLIVMTASQLICLVLRFSKPTNRPRRNLSVTTSKCQTFCDLSNSESCSSSNFKSPEEATAFLIRSKHGSEKKTEFRFYII